MDEKKKLMVIGTLAVALLGIGAFQFTKGSAPAPAPAPAAKPAETASVPGTDDAKTETAEAPQQNDLVSGAYAVRDPFHPLVDPNASATPNPMPSGPVNRVAMARPTFGPDIDKSGGFGLPAASGGVTTPIRPPAPEFPYKLAGIIVGRKPAAVFVDLQGAQHLVELGGALDGDTRLEYLDREHVVLRFKNKTKNLTLGGGNSSAN